MLDFGRNEWRIARKPHECYLCGKEIQKGERYYYADGREDGEFFHTHYHESCEEILRLYFRAHSGDDEWDHCWVTDWLEEYCQDNCEQYGQCGRSVFECEKIRKIIRGVSNG